MAQIRFHSGEDIPLELHKVRIVQKLDLVSVERRVHAIGEAGYNTFLLKNKDIFLDMLTDSGVNAMSDRQLAAMMVADDSYAGSATFTRLTDKLEEIFGTKWFLPAHQGRAWSWQRTAPGPLLSINVRSELPERHRFLSGDRSSCRIPHDRGVKKEWLPDTRC